MLTAKASTDYQPVEAGTHPARCVSVIDLGTQRPSNPSFREAHKVLLEWELPNETYEADGEKAPRRIARSYTLSIGKRAKLREHLQTWRGKPFTPEELEGFDIQNILGHPCMLSVVHETVGDKTYANISSVSKLPKGMPIPEQYWESTIFHLEDGKDSDAFKKLPEWIRGKILQCVEWNAGPGAPMESQSNGHDEVAGADDEVPF